MGMGLGPLRNALNICHIIMLKEINSLKQEMLQLVEHVIALP